jgi:hypothetical protein
MFDSLIGIVVPFMVSFNCSNAPVYVILYTDIVMSITCTLMTEFCVCLFLSVYKSAGFT